LRVAIIASSLAWFIWGTVTVTGHDCQLQLAVPVCRGQSIHCGAAVTKESEKQLLGPIVYLWLALSLLLNVSGIASIVDGFVHWANFFKDFLDIYRHWIREPLSWAVHLVLALKIPPWVFDYFVISSAFFFGTNAMGIRRDGRSFFIDPFAVFILYIYGPILLPFLFSVGDAKVKSRTRECLIYTGAVFATVIVLMFLNWQFQHIGN